MQSCERKSATKVDATNVKKRGEREREMTRAEAKEQLISLGVEEPSEDAVTNYLNTIQASVKSAEDKALKYKEDAMRVKELQKQLQDIEDAKLTDIEREKKNTEDALKEVESLKNTVKQMQLQKSLAEIGIVGDDANTLISEDGALNTVKLGEILAAREKSAVAAFQKKALDETPTPNGSKDDPEPTKPYKEIADRVAASKKAEADAVSIINQYK